MKHSVSFFSITAALGIIALFSLSCNKSTLNTPQTAGYTEISDEQSAMENFSISLSKIIFSHPEVRGFLKNEALKRFDNDDEVFYPFIKDKQGGDLGTFRQILVNELGSEGRMEKIEKQLLTLTILVSDATWIDKDGFCLDNWDTTDPYVAITYQEKDGTCKKLFGNGCLLGTIEKGTIPGGPVLIVKESERLAASIPTKGGEVEYSFLYDAFDASKNEPKTKDIYSAEWLNEAQGNASDRVSPSFLKDINPDILQAHLMFKNNQYACQNDYIYYGMTSDEPKGRIRTDVRSKIYRFKLNPDAYTTVMDDFGPEEHYADWYEFNDGGRGYDEQDTKETVYAKLWADGSLEIRFTVLAGNSNETAVYSVKARKLFTVKDNIVKKEQWKATLIKWHITWRYSFNEANFYDRSDSSLNPKWYYPNDNFTLPVWDLLSLSSYSIKVEEIDRGVTHTEERSIMIKCASSSTNKINNENQQGEKTEFGWTANDEITKTLKQTISWKDENEPLYSKETLYSDKYIKSYDGGKCELYSYGSNIFQFTILPYRY